MAGLVSGAGPGVAARTGARRDAELSSPHRPARGIRAEELFAAGWSSSFLGAIEQAAADLAVRLPSERSVEAEVDLGSVASNGYFRRIRLSVSLPGLPYGLVRELVEAASAACLYWNATRGNIDVAIDFA